MRKIRKDESEGKRSSKKSWLERGQSAKKTPLHLREKIRKKTKGKKRDANQEAHEEISKKSKQKQKQ
jgi:hypothetical protein